MDSSSNSGEKPPTPPHRSTAILLIGTIADTTWRMFIPIIGLMSFGLWIDSLAHTVCLFMVVGIIVGTWIASVLVKRQLRRVQKAS